jgi:hypothetical protein
MVMTRAFIVAAIATAFIAGRTTAPEVPSAARAAMSDTVTLALGDRIRVQRTEVGCRVARLNAYAGRVFVDCRKAGPLAGTYATFLGEREVLVVRFQSGRTAKVVFRARHAGGASKCH